MRTIQTENATYKIADSRNLEDFVKQLKKPKSAAKRYKAEKRVFPAFVAGETSTYGYLRSYYFTNKLMGGGGSLCIKAPNTSLQNSLNKI